MNFNRPNHQIFYAFGLIYFFIGFAAIMVQSVLLREFLVIAYGNELILGTLFAVWFFWIAMGAGLGSPLLRRSHNPQVLFWLVLLVGLVLFPLQVLAIRLGRAVLAVPVGTFMPFVKTMIWSLLCLAPFSLMIGLTFPLGAHLHRNLLPERIQVIGYLYIFEAVGSLVGGLLFTFFVVEHFQLLRIGQFLLLLALLVLLVSGRSIFIFRQGNWLVLGGILFGLILTFSANGLQQWSLQRRWQNIGGKENKLISSLDTRYDHITIAKISDQYGFFQNGQLSYVFPDPYQSDLQAELILLQHLQPHRLLVVSDGVHDLLHALLRHPDLNVDWILRDRQVFMMLEPLLKDSIRVDLYSDRVHWHWGDGRNFLRQKQEELDLIDLDLPPPATAMLNRYYTLEFFRETATALRADGVLVLRLPVSDNYLGEEVAQFTASIYYTLKQVFAEVALTSGEEIYLFAAKQPGVVTTDVAVLTRRWQQRMIRHSTFSPYMLYSILQPERLQFLQSKLAAVPSPPINTDDHPVSYFYNLILWSRFTGSDRLLGFLWRSLSHLHLLIVVGLLFAIFLARVFWLILNRKPPAKILRWNGLMSVAISGFTAMSLEIVLLFGYQNLFGSLYQNVALVTALFMFGLAVGSWWFNRRVQTPEQLPVYFITLAVCAALIAVFLPSLFHGLHLLLWQTGSSLTVQGCFLLLVIFVGALTGAIFPLAGKALWQARSQVGATAGAVDAADHSGACLGAFLAGTFLLPVLGTQGSVLIVAFGNGLAILCWLILPKLANHRPSDS